MGALKKVSAHAAQKSTIIGVILMVLTIVGNPVVLHGLTGWLEMAQTGAGFSRLAVAALGVAMVIYREASSHPG